MADFAAVLRKTIDALAENTAETRARVYGRARETVEAKLTAASSPPEVVTRQKELLESAIAKVEAEYQEASGSPDFGDELDGFFDSLDEPVEASAPVATDDEPQEELPPEPEPVPERDAASEAAETDGPEQAPVGDDNSESRDPGALNLSGARFEAIPQGADANFTQLAQPAPAEAHEGASFAAEVHREPKRGGRRRALILAPVILIVLGAAAYGGWHFREDLTRLANLATEGDPEPQESVGQTPEETGGEQQSASADGISSSPQDTAQETEPVEEPAKFTQRLTSDGQEIDAGPAVGEPGLGEGTSVAAATQASGAPQQGNASSEEAVPVGQRAIFYEERTSASEGSAESGNVVWSVAQESPGDGLPPEPVIRAEATIPDKNIQLKVTIRRNVDQSLPASHIVELIFLTSDQFEGGGINNVARIAMKRTEQDTGSPLLGIPAKIADGFFLVALNDSQADREANVTLMRRQNWIDIPLIYKSGRRALITLEKGVPGEKIFNEAIQAWSAASSG